MSPPFQNLKGPGAMTCRIQFGPGICIYHRSGRNILKYHMLQLFLMNDFNTIRKQTNFLHKAATQVHWPPRNTAFSRPNVDLLITTQLHDAHGDGVLCHQDEYSW